MEPLEDTLTVDNYKMENHVTTFKVGPLVILGMNDKLSFVDVKQKVCLIEFECEGKVDSVRASNDGREIYIYTNDCKLYRI